MQRVVRAGGPALLFENPKSRADALARQRLRHRAADGSGAGRRAAWTRSATGSASCSSPSCPGASAGSRMPWARSAQLRQVPPRRVKAAPCQEVVLRGDEVDLGLLPGDLRVAGGRRGLPEPRPDPHQAPGDRRAQPRHVPAAAAGRADRQPALADPQGLDLARGHRRAARGTPAGGDRVRLPTRGHLRGVARRCRPISTSTCSPGSCSASGSTWSTACPCRCRCPPPRR